MNVAHDRRKAELAKIHIARSQLALDEDTYRAMLWTVARVHSAADLDDIGRRRVLDHLAGLGFKTRRPGRSTPAEGKERMVAKIYALLADRPVEYADGMARKMFHVERFEWCTGEQMHKLIAALTYDAKRRASR